MSRLQKRDPKYCLHKASGRALVIIDGKRHYLGKHGTKASRELYHRKIAEAAATQAAPSDAAEVFTVNQLLAGFLEHAREYYGRSAGGNLGRIKRSMRHVRALYGTADVREFGPLAFKAVRQRMIDAGWVRTSINKQMQIVRAFFKWGVSNELLPSTVWEALRTVEPLKYGRTKAEESEPIKPVPDAFVEAVALVVSPQVAAMIDLQRLTGMRPGEVCEMRACDLDTTGAVWLYRPATHKNRWRGHDRVVALGPKAQAVVKRFLKPNVEAFLFSPADAVAQRHERRAAERKTPLSCGNRPGSYHRKLAAAGRKAKKRPGERYDVPSYRRAVKYGIKLVNKQRANDEAEPIPAWHPHQLRHNYATLIRRQFGLEKARAALGHKHTQATEIYAELDTAATIEIAGRIG